jgi:protein TonB
MIASHNTFHTLSRVGLALLIAVGVWIVVDGINSNKFQHVEAPQVVTLLDEPEIEEIEEPEMVEPEEYFEEAEVPDMEPMEDINDLLGLDDDASAGFDQFGLVAKKGGQDLIGSSDGSSAMRFDLARVKSLIESHLNGILQSNVELRKKSYSVILKFWIDASGYVEKVKLLNSTGDTKIDRDIEQTLRRIPPFSSELKDIPQPITLKIIARSYVN